MGISRLNASPIGAVQFKGTVTADKAPHYITFPGHQDVFSAFEGRVNKQLKSETHLDLTSSTYNTSGGRRQEHYVTVSHQGDKLVNKAYIGAWGADENRASNWDALAWIPGKLGRWATNERDKAWYASHLNRAFNIAKNAEPKAQAKRLDLVHC